MAARVTSESARRVSGCVTALLREQPFFGSLALRLPNRADASRETVASDGREIRYSPRWIAAGFGTAERLVEQRLRLGNVAPDLLDAYRADEIDLEVLKAFSVITCANSRP